MENITDFPLDIKTTVERKASRTDICFDGLFRFYRNFQGSWNVETCEFNPHYAKTFNFQGDFSEDIGESVSEYFEDPLEFIDLLLEVDPTFNLLEYEKDEEIHISVIGVFLETTEQEGDYESGYYDILILTPKIVSYEIVDNDKAFLYLIKEIYSKEIYSDE